MHLAGVYRGGVRQNFPSVSAVLCCTVLKKINLTLLGSSWLPWIQTAMLGLKKITLYNNNLTET